MLAAVTAILQQFVAAMLQWTRQDSFKAAQGRTKDNRAGPNMGGQGRAKHNRAGQNMGRAWQDRGQPGNSAGSNRSEAEGNIQTMLHSSCTLRLADIKHGSYQQYALTQKPTHSTTQMVCAACSLPNSVV